MWGNLTQLETAAEHDIQVRNETRNRQLVQSSNGMATIALIAHDGKKVEMVEFAKKHRDRLAQFDLIATGSTGRIVSISTGLEIQTLRHGPGGGDVQIASQVLEGHVHAVFFFVEPMEAHPHDPDIQTLMRICNIENVPLATNPATADLVVRGFGETAQI